MVFRQPDAPTMVESHGFNFVSDPVAAGTTHTATIQWSGQNARSGCVSDRSLIVLHK